MTYIIDTTLRDGEQSPGVHFSLQQKIAIASLLDQIGIQELEVGTPAMGTEVQNDIREILTSGFSFRSCGWCRTRVEDLDAAAYAGLNQVHISLPSSALHLESLGWSYQHAIHQLQKILKIAYLEFDLVSVGIQDASRAHEEFIEELILLAESEGVFRIRLADTCGIMTPEDTSALFNWVNEIAPNLEYEFHGHNDFGLATANSLVALNNGADCVSTTVCGIGERAGNAATEAVLMASRHLYDNPMGLNPRVIQNLCDLVSNSSNQAIPPQQPICGTQIFTHESGIHVRGQIHNELTYQAYKPQETGHSPSQIVFGSHSGLSAVKFFMEVSEIQSSLQEEKTLLEMIHRESQLQKRPLNLLDVYSLYFALKLNSRFKIEMVQEKGQ
jgi:homocitrate synthase NifV